MCSSIRFGSSAGFFAMTSMYNARDIVRCRLRCRALGCSHVATSNRILTGSVHATRFVGGSTISSTCESFTADGRIR